MKQLHQHAITLLALSVIIYFGATPANLHAATITVTNTADSGTGTLRDALASAANGDTINFSLPLPATIRLTDGELAITKNVAISGPGANHLSVDGNAASIIFHIVGSNTVLIAGLTITNGRGIASEGATLTVSNCIISGNSGGGIYNYASSGSANLIIVNSTVSGNFAQFGGGIVNLSQGGSANLIILNSTVSGNTAQFAGGIWNIAQGGSAVATIHNSTVSGNISSYAGGIWNEAEGGGSIASLRIANSTFSGNSADYAGGIWNYYDTGGGATTEIGSTILNAGGSGSNLANEPGASITSDGYNLTSDDGAGVLTNATDQINTDPKLGPLQDNGGPIFTHAFTCRSAAIDHGRNFSASATDQRGVGFIRTFDDPAAPDAADGDGTDIGAFEAQLTLSDCDNPPVADASATPLLVISPNNTNATAVLDGSRSSDPDGDLLQYDWSESGIPLASGVVAVTVLPVGTHPIQLVVSDGHLTATNVILIGVITAAEAVNRLVVTLNSDVPHSHPLVASLRAALASIDRSNPVSAINQLQAFQNKVRAQVGPIDPALAASLIQSAQDVLDVLSAGGKGKTHGHLSSLVRKANGQVQLQLSTEAPGTYILEASTDLINWKMIGVATSLVNGQFQFEDAQSTNFASRYYRVVQP